MIVMQLKDMSTVLARIARIKASAPAVTAMALNGAAKDTVVPSIRKEILAKKISFEGGLYKSINSRIKTLSPPTVHVGSFGLDYAPAIEFGQKPGTHQDVNKLQEWAQRKLGAIPPRDRFIAIRLKRKIEATGTEAKPVIFPGYNRVKKELFNEFISRLKRSNLL